MLKSLPPLGGHLCLPSIKRKERGVSEEEGQALNCKPKGKMDPPSAGSGLALMPEVKAGLANGWPPPLQFEGSVVTTRWSAFEGKFLVFCFNGRNEQM